jgi:hypothetical protein
MVRLRLVLPREAARSRRIKASAVAIALPCAGCLAPSVAVAALADMDMAGRAVPLEWLDAVALPTLGEWGMLAATLSLLGAGTSIILRHRRH